MNIKRKNLIIIGIMFILFGSYVSLDWSRLFLINSNTIRYIDSFRVVKFLKLTVSFLCLLLAFTTYNCSITKTDSKRIRVAFIAIFLGDLSFTTGHTTLGIVTFAIGQLLISFRNSNGIKKYFNSKSFLKDKLYISIILITLLIIDIFLLKIVFYSNIDNQMVMWGFTLYSLVLCLSVFISWLSIKIGYFPKVNSIMILVGMSFFFLCDFTVGYGILADNIIFKEIATSSTWIFYTPALILLSTSSYDYNKCK
ncbi:hypothetical protein EW093_16820 [Thiospirochaeta perfilievii]|uniref:YhhN-like protein n=1 Tax=Thiospirochaeta perfilievii TaxID=252967 RepID=A0A5C1QH05_9SPIO|nr:hypothetical protein [Thiospirochaeta perfilievii]QEN06280.1 hypothetical protein EW093_16820 [Thiospirochaeta perfilievii]